MLQTATALEWNFEKKKVYDFDCGHVHRFKRIARTNGFSVAQQVSERSTEFDNTGSTEQKHFLFTVMMQNVL